MYDFVLIDKTSDSLTAVTKHAHPMWELFYVRVGTGHYHNSGQSYPFSPGDIFITRPDELHYETSPQGYGNYFVFFRDFFLPPDRPFYHLHDVEDCSLLALLQVLYHAAHNEPNYSLCSALFESIHQYICTLLPNTEQNVYVERLKQEIDANFCNPDYKPTSQVKDSPFCADHIRRIFTKSVGYTPLQYLISLRINHAKQLIISSRYHLSLKKIAFDSGYSDYYYFSRQFKQQTGFSPREWAKLSPYNLPSPDSTPINE